jgi:hypothetical protein
MYRISRSALAIARRDSRNVPITVLKGSMVEIIDGPFDRGLMEVRFDGEIVMMFTNDMETEEIIKAELPAVSLVEPSEIRSSRVSE